ncbi:MAG: Fur family transcriptional regulator, ferric uptake regulator [Acidimicrobiaceae bacterium]|nr:Fur family transcriptional regulator, ferric uptake regulator [Acidimicrobiaceae bacterium]
MADRTATVDGLHPEVAVRLARVEQRYTASRRALVETLAAAGRPLSIPEILAATPAIPQSSAYRNVTALIDAKALRRVAGSDDHGRFELAEDLAGHHHHLICESCGQVVDVAASPRLERALAEAARVAEEETGFTVDDHRMDLVGTCRNCRT